MRAIQVTGRVVANPERRVSDSGTEYMTFRIANSEFFDTKDKNSKDKANPYWFGVTSYNKKHFNLQQHLTKGKPVIIVGDYSDRIYQRKDGTCDISRDIIANAIYFNSIGNSENQAEGTTANAEPKTQTNFVPEAKPTTQEITVPSETETDELPF